MRLWQKFSVIASALVTAGCSCTPDTPSAPPVQTPEPSPNTDPLAQGFYKVASAKTVFYVDDSQKKLKPILELDRNTCVRVMDGTKGHDVVLITVSGQKGYVSKADLILDAACDTREVKDPSGLKLESRAIFLYETPESTEPMAQIVKGQCVVVLGARAAEGWTRVAAQTPRGRFEGWGYEMQINTRFPCLP